MRYIRNSYFTVYAILYAIYVKIKKLKFVKSIIIIIFVRYLNK